MNSLSNAHHFRKTVAGICMVGAPLALLLAMVFESKIGISENAYVIGKVGDPDTGQIEQVLLVAGLVLMVPAVLGLMHMLREREVDFGHVGGAVALLGLLVLPWAFMAGVVILAFGLYRAQGRAVHVGAVHRGRGDPPGRRRRHRERAVRDRRRRRIAGRLRLDRPDGAVRDRRGVGAHARGRGLPGAARDVVPFGHPPTLDRVGGWPQTSARRGCASSRRRSGLPRATPSRRRSTRRRRPTPTTASGWRSTSSASIEEGIAARERAFEGYARADRCDEAARVGVWVSHQYLLSGRTSAARGWLARADRAVADPECEGQGWVAIERARHAETFEERAEHARRAMDIARESGNGDLETFALSLLGLTEVNAGRLESGMQLLEEAMAAASAGRVRNVHTLAEAYCNLIMASTNAGDWERAAEWCELVDEFAREHGTVPLLGACRTIHADVLVARGRWPEAEHALETALETHARFVPEMGAPTVASMAELRVRQGRLAEAEQLLAGREEHPSSLCALAHLRIADGRPQVAAGAAGARSGRRRGRRRPHHAAARAAGRGAPGVRGPGGRGRRRRRSSPSSRRARGSAWSRPAPGSRRRR